MTADELREWREQQTLMTQGEAAKRFGLSLRAWQNYESGERPVPEAIVASVRAYKPETTDTVRVTDMHTEQTEAENTHGDTHGLNSVHIDGFDPVAAGLRPYPTTNTQWGASKYWDTRTPKPGWKRVAGCIRIVRDTIPEPLPFYGPEWAGDDGVPTASGEVYDAITGRMMRDYRSVTKPVRTNWSNPKKAKGER